MPGLCDTFGKGRRDRLILKLQARCELRIGELLKLKVSNVSDRTITLRNPKSGKESDLACMPVSIMSQYSPQHKAHKIPLLSRKIFVAEYDAVVDTLPHLGIENGWTQSPNHYLPDFERDGHTFDPAPVGAIHESPSTKEGSS